MSVHHFKGTEAMGKAPIWGLLARFSGPAIVAQIVNASYNLIDTIFIGRSVLFRSPPSPLPIR